MRNKQKSRGDNAPGGMVIHQQLGFLPEPLPFRPPKYVVDRKKARSDEKVRWEESLRCVCGSELPVLRRFKRGGEWTGWCRRCTE